MNDSPKQSLFLNGILLSILILGINLSSISRAQTEIVSNSQDPNDGQSVNPFYETKSWESFEKIDPSLKQYILTTFLFKVAKKAKDPNDVNYDKQISDILNSYYQAAEPSLRKKINVGVFEFALMDSKPEIAAQYFKIAFSDDLEDGRSTICTSMAGLTSNFEAINTDLGNEASEALAGVIAQNPTLANQYCEVNSQKDGTYAIKILDVIKRFNPRAAQRLTKMLRAQQNRVGGTPTNLQTKPFGSCTKQQLERYFLGAVRSLEPYSAPVTQIISIQDGNCLIHGFLDKTNSGFTFEMNASIPGLKKRIIRFTETKSLPPELLP